MSSLLQAALQIAATGIPVFPCGPDKAPRVPGGFHSATLDPMRIQAWNWNSGAMIGAAIPEGLLVVDIDPRNGGDATLSTLPPLPGTLTVKTRSGGKHLYYHIPDGISLRGSLGPGVDIKRPGKGYVIRPPSEGYTFARRLSIAPAPVWLIEELEVQERESNGEASDAKYFGFETGTAYGLAGLEKAVGRLVQALPGERNNALNAAAFGMAQLVAGGELEEEHARETLTRTAEIIGLSISETKATIDSGWAAGEQAPWQAPDRENAPRPVGPVVPRSWTPPQEEDFWVDWEIDEPDLPFYMHPVLPKHAYVLVYGATEASKSMAWVGMLAEGSRHGVKTSVYSLENPPATDRQRVRRWRPSRDNFRLTNQHLDFSDLRQVEALIAREKDWGTDVILIDTYSHAFHSYSDDGNAKAIAFAQVVRHVMAEVDCSVVVIDHTGYMQQDEPRDASAKRQQVDVAILMKKAGVWTPGQPSRFTMENKKAARFANPFFETGEIHDVKIKDFKALDLRWQGEGPKWVT